MAESFEPFRDRRIGADRAEAFLRRRTAMLISGPAAVAIDADVAELSERIELTSEAPWNRGEEISSADLGCAAAIAPDGYFLTAAHCLAAGPTHVALEAHGKIVCAAARVVWSDGAHDIALVHAGVEPEAWFDLVPDRALAAGERVLVFGHVGGAAAGELEESTDVPALGAYVAVALAHDTPLRRGHSGAPAAMLDGQLLGVNSSTGMETIFRRRSWLVRVSPAVIAGQLDDDRARRAAHGRPSAPPF